MARWLASSVTDAVRHYRIGYVSEDRKNEGLILQHDVASNIAATVWHRIRRFLDFISDRMQAATAAPFVERLSIRDPTCSSGWAIFWAASQKVSVAKWLAASSKILTVDEPTIGIDIAARPDLHDLIIRLSRDGAPYQRSRATCRRSWRSPTGSWS